jgi:hypothetical protein
MAVSYLDIHTAQRKMVLKDANACLSFVSTLWKGEVIMCCFNNLNKEIANVFCTQIIDPEDLTQLESLVRDFIHGG